jgi:excisionase family DNA binding protein
MRSLSLIAPGRREPSDLEGADVTSGVALLGAFCVFCDILSIMLADDLAPVHELAADLHARGQEEQARALEVVLDLATSALVGRSAPARPREYLTTSQAAAALGVSRQAIKNWVQAGSLRGAALGGRTLIHRDEVQAQLDRLLSARPPVPPVGEDLEVVRSGYETSVKAVPAELLGRLDALHKKLEQGERLTRDERGDVVALERKVTHAASGALAKRVRRRTTSGAD